MERMGPDIKKSPVPDRILLKKLSIVPSPEELPTR
jgi:hypothetical protein